MKTLALEQKNLTLRELAKLMQNEPVLITEKGMPIMTVYAAPQDKAEGWEISQSQDLDGLLEDSRQSLRQEGGLSLQEMRQELGLL